MNWDASYRTGETPWDKGAAAAPLLEWLALPGHRLEGEVIVPGCGLGHDVRAIAALETVRAVCGPDLSARALELARQQPAVGKETYLLADLFALLDELRGRFDWVFEHTCFCAIEPDHRPDYVRAVTQALRPGGRLLAIFYLDPLDRGSGPARAGRRAAVRSDQERTGPAFRRRVRIGRGNASDARVSRARRRRGRSPFAQRHDLGDRASYTVRDDRIAAWR